jgi:hypothetical protein
LLVADRYRDRRVFLDGWGGPALLDSYEGERRQVGLRNMKASGNAAAGVGKWRTAWADGSRGTNFLSTFDVHQRSVTR